ncbi:hypothetical protein Hdeb2414_s0025g00659901 [Helianthus debilis subsp. tardiflorus]
MQFNSICNLQCCVTPNVFKSGRDSETKAGRFIRFSGFNIGPVAGQSGRRVIAIVSDRSYLFIYLFIFQSSIIFILGYS